MEVLLNSIVERIKKQTAEEIAYKLYNNSKYIFSSDGKPTLIINAEFVQSILAEYSKKEGDTL